MLQVLDADGSFAKLAEAVERSGRNIRKEAAAVVNAVATKTQSGINKEIRTELAVKKKAIDGALEKGPRANAKNPFTDVTLKATRRIPLKEFKARQTKKGTSYRISKSTGRRSVPGAFVSNKLGGHVFKRRSKKRLPIQKLYGPSPLRVFRRKEMLTPTRENVRAELRKQMLRRIKFNNLKAEGTI